MANCWTAENKTITHCEAYEGKKPIIIMSWAVARKVKRVTSKVGQFEWLGYLKGTVDQKKLVYTINDVVVPKQEVGAGFVEVMGGFNDDILGTVHLHPMANGLFFSSVDDEFVGGNHEVTVVTNKDGEFIGKVKVPLPCKRNYLAEAVVFVDTPEPEGLEEFADKALLNIEKEKPVAIMVNQGFPPLVEHYCAKCRQLGKVDTFRDGFWYHLGCANELDKKEGRQRYFGNNI